MAYRLKKIYHFMSNDAPQLELPPEPPLRLGVVASLFNQHWVDSLLTRALSVLSDAGHPVGAQDVIRVPGALEGPFALELLERTQRGYQGYLVLGLVVAGQTNHHQLISDSTAVAFHQFTARTAKPVINGILVVHDEVQARARIQGEYDRGAEFARALLYTANLYRQLCPKNPK